MDTTVKIGANTKIGKNPIIGNFVCIGMDCEELDCYIGSSATIRSHTVIYGGTRIGNDFQTGHGALVRERTTIGDAVSIGSHTVVEHHVTIGNNVRVHSGVFIPEYSVLEDGAWIGPKSVLTNAKYPLSKNAKKELKGAVIKKNAKIGANVTLLPAITIGEGSLVGAGSVVTKDVPPFAVVAGNPARIINNLKNLPYV